MRREELLAEKQRLQAEIDAAYWRFCRSEQGRVASASVYTRFNEVRFELGEKVYAWQWTQTAIAAIDKMPASKHRVHVQQALREGKPVPPEVLADYPDLKESN